MFVVESLFGLQELRSRAEHKPRLANDPGRQKAFLGGPNSPKICKGVSGTGFGLVEASVCTQV